MNSNLWLILLHNASHQEEYTGASLPLKTPIVQRQTRTRNRNRWNGQIAGDLDLTPNVPRVSSPFYNPVSNANFHSLMLSC